MRPWLLKAGFDEYMLSEHFVEWGQGMQSMSPALRALESDLLNASLAHGNHPVLSMCAGNAVVKTDPAGNRKLDKMRSAGRIDGMVALAMARGVAAARSRRRIFRAAVPQRRARRGRMRALPQPPPSRGSARRRG